MRSNARFIDDRVLAVGDFEFYCASVDPGRAREGSLSVRKHRDNVERYVELASAIEPRVIVELGIATGGSTALLNEVFDPDVVVAIELDTRPGAALNAYLERAATGGRIHAFYGIDQADRAALSQALDAVIGDQSIDLVIDDASHRYSETRASFEVLFPRVRPGGLFIIEDWNTDQLLGDAVEQIRRDPSSPHYEAVRAADAGAGDGIAAPPPLTQLTLELILLRGSAGQAIHEITINENWVVIERGSDPLDPERFSLSDLVRNHDFGFR